MYSRVDKLALETKWSPNSGAPGYELVDSDLRTVSCGNSAFRATLKQDRITYIDREMQGLFEEWSHLTDICSPKC